MNTLEQEYKDHPDKLKFLKSRLLLPGWAGEVDDIEAAFIAERLNADRKLWLQWRHHGHLKGMRRHVTPGNVKILVLKLAPIGIEPQGRAKIPTEEVLKHADNDKSYTPGGERPVLKHAGGRPKSTTNFSRSTAWRRQKEQQLEMLPVGCATK
jgi:hypothetical protein